MKGVRHRDSNEATLRAFYNTSSRVCSTRPASVLPRQAKVNRISQDVGGQMFEQAKNLRPGDVVIDRGRRFIVKRVVINPDTGMIGIINTDDSWHGEYHPDEYLGIVSRATGIQLSTARFATLLTTAQAWDGRYAGMCHAQQCFLFDEFVFADRWCVLVRLEQRRQWDIPRVAGGRLFTRCG